MIDIIGVRKAAAVDSRSYFSEVVDRAGVGRWWAGVFDAQSAFGIDFVWSLGRNQRAVAGDDLLLAFGIHGGSGVNVFSILYGKLYYPIQSEYCNKNLSEAEDEGSPSEVDFGQWVFNDIFLSGNWNKRYSVVNPLW